MSTTQQRLLLISPIRNEEAHFERIAAAVAAQTRRPDAWVVVDDASTDATPEILDRLARQLDFLQVVSAPKRNQSAQLKDRLAVALEAKAFNVGLGSVDWRSFTHIAKLDGDTELPPYYFERLLAEFERDQSLGLAGGLYADPCASVDGEEQWAVVGIPSDHHVPGTLKCYSRDCFEAIGGMYERLAWDTIDETYARMRGYRTRAFADLIAHHHRPFASADGILRGRARHGECAYIVHFTLPWVTLRAFKVALVRPRVLSGVAFLYGYLRSAFRRVPRVEDPEFRRFVRRELRSRMRMSLTGNFQKNPLRGCVKHIRRLSGGLMKLRGNS